MFHPAAALRNPDWRREMAKDIQRIPEMLRELEAAKAHPGRLQRSDAEDAEEFEQLSLF